MSGKVKGRREASWESEFVKGEGRAEWEFVTRGGRAEGDQGLHNVFSRRADR